MSFIAKILNAMKLNDDYDDDDYDEQEEHHYFPHTVFQCQEEVVSLIQEVEEFENSENPYYSYYSQCEEESCAFEDETEIYWEC